MTTSTISFARLQAIEPSLQIDAPWCGSFLLDAHRIRCRLDAASWLELSAPVAGSRHELLAAQTRLPLPVKVVSGPAVVAEMPGSSELSSAFSILRQATRRALRHLNGESDDDRELNPMESSPQLDDLLQSSTFTWCREDDHAATHLTGETITAEMSARSVTFRSRVLNLTRAGDVTFAALADLLLALNGRLRFARGTLESGRVVVEVVLPKEIVTATLVDHAVAAIGAGNRLARRPCTALLDPRVAEQYLEVSGGGENVDADTHD